jgi:hypothetical protein
MTDPFFAWVTPSLLCESDPTNSYNPWANTTTSPDFTLTEMSCIRKLPVMGASLHWTCTSYHIDSAEQCDLFLKETLHDS